MLFTGFSIFSSVGHLVQRIGTIWEILVEGHPTIIPGKYYQNRPSGYGGDRLKDYLKIGLSFLALAAIFCSRAE